MAVLVTEGTRGRSTWLRRDTVAVLVTEGTRGLILSPWACPDAIAVAVLVTKGTRGFIFVPSL